MASIKKTITRIIEASQNTYRQVVHSVHFEEDNFARVMSIEFSSDGTLQFAFRNTSILGGTATGLIVLENSQIDYLMDFLRKCKGEK